eukprot:3163609-Pleurochrysis_carterae.AAC.1
MQRAVTANTVARKASTSVTRELSTHETASYSQMTARTVLRRIYVIQRKRHFVPSVAGESGDRMAPLIRHSPSTH